MNKNEWQQYYNGEKNYKYSVIHNLDFVKINISALWKTLFKGATCWGKCLQTPILQRTLSKYRKDSENKNRKQTTQLEGEAIKSE